MICDLADYDVCCHLTADVYKHETDPFSFVVVCLTGQVYILNSKSNKYDFFVLVKADEKADSPAVIYQKIDNKMNAVFNQGLKQVSWNQITGASVVCWQIRFVGISGEDSFQTYSIKFLDASYKSKVRDEYKALPAGDEEYMRMTNMEDVVMEDDSSFNTVSSGEDDSDGDHTFGTPSPKQKLRSGVVRSDSESDGESDGAKFMAGKKANKLLMIGSAGNARYRSQFVTRGNKVGVFREDDDGDAGLKYKGFFKVDTDPSQGMLHNRDQNMLLMGYGDQHVVKNYDIEAGKVVQNILVDEDINIEQILPKSKYEQRSGTEDFLGIGRNSLFNIDPRLNTHAKRVTETTKMYSTPTKFTQAATTLNGHVVVASETGEIRLYSKVGQSAKTLLPGLGDSIIGLDVTAQGDYVLATCKDYLLLVSTRHPVEEGKSLFQKSCGKDKKPIARQLRLRPETLVQMNIREVTFTPAKFRTSEEGSSSESRSIVTSCGRFAITWNLSSVTRNKLYDYKVKDTLHDIQTDNFLYDRDSKVLAVLPDELLLIEKKNFVKPKTFQE